MKKISYILVIALLIIPFSVYAATTPVVEELNAEVSGATISYNGTMSTGSHAVMCKLFNSENEEIDLLSSPVDKSKFEGSFKVYEKGEYKVSCANYEGGEFKDAKVTVKDIPKTSNPDTGDKILLFISVGIISLSLMSYLLYKSKNKLKVIK